MTTRPRIPMSLITGFLGSGKTTLLRRLIETQATRRIVYVINEFGAVDVDGRALNLRDGQWVSIPGGSIFCTCLTGDFLRHLERIPDAFAGESRPVEGVLIEASGVADPRVVSRMLAEARLDAVYALCRVISVIDPATFPKLLHTLPSITAQVEACDLALVNKTDLYSERQIAWSEDALRQINAGAEILRTSYCHTAFDPWTPARRAEASGDYAHSVDPNYVRLVVRIDRPIDLEVLRHELESLLPAVYRIKGWIHTPEGDCQVDVSAGGVNLAPMPERGRDAGGDSLLVCIFPPTSLAAVEDFGIRASTGRLAGSPGR